ncbi:hypothetical protein OPT61_g4505 [Boeremia exigua]|uniref:Uncharacterized protein n=1 Tax=Boeremia exigua TaxID=749465 RepID=A0ACC2IDT7_9PLEO|nr:hypothetical protein OPT61_g4505 [Boeremia exigua]
MEDAVKAGEVPIGTPPPGAYGITSVRRNTTFMKTCLFEEWAAKHAGKISFVHVYPGLVDGEGFYAESQPKWFRWLWPVVKMLLAWYMTSPETCGEVMVFLATERYPAAGMGVEGQEVAVSSRGERGGGAYAVGQRGDEGKGVSWAKVRREDTGRVVWQHTMGELERVEKLNWGV